MAWDGSAFSGWQKQVHQRTIQGELERALSGICGYPIRVQGCGRTDKGVHAAIYLATGHWERDTPKGVLARLRQLLPAEIGILAVDDLSTPLQARHDASARRYTMLLVGNLLPWERPYRTILPAAVDRDLFAALAQRFLGRQCYDGLVKDDQGHSTVERIKVGSWSRGLVLQIDANRFLRQQVRGMAGILAAVAARQLPEQALIETLATGSRANSWIALSGNGLALDGIRYGQVWELPPPGASWYNQVGEIIWWS